MVRVAMPEPTGGELNPLRWAPTALKKVLQAIHPTKRIHRQTIMMLRYFIQGALHGLAAQAAIFRGARKTLTARDIQSAVRVVIPSELSRHAIAEGTKAVVKAADAKSRLSQAAGLMFPVTGVIAELKKTPGRYGSRIAKPAGVYLTAVLEYLTCEVLELSGNAAKKRGYASIFLFDVKSAIGDDDELKTLGSRISFPNPAGGHMMQMFEQVPPVPQPLGVEDLRAHGQSPFAKAPFMRVLREIATEQKDGIRFRADAAQLFQNAAAHHLAQKLQPSPAPSQAFCPGPVAKVAVKKPAPLKKKAAVKMATTKKTASKF